MFLVEIKSSQAGSRLVTRHTLVLWEQRSDLALVHIPWLIPSKGEASHSSVDST